MVELVYQLDVSGLPNWDGLRIPFSQKILKLAAEDIPGVSEDLQLQRLPCIW